MSFLRFNILSLKIAGGVALVLLVLVVGLDYLFGLSVGSVLLVAILSGGVSYGISHYVLHRRIKQASTTLRRLRRHEFDNPPSYLTVDGDELDELLQEVYHTGRTVEKEFKELRKMENYRREFLGNVSHELKTPIFSIQGFTETLLNGALEDSRVNRRFLEKIAGNTERLNDLTNDLSEIARLEMEDLEIIFEPVNLSTLAREVIESLEVQAGDKELRLHCEVSKHLPPVRANREHLRQLLSNLVDNAIKYNESGGFVRLKAQLLSNDDIKVSVTDNGIGISAEDLPRLTERFFRADKSRSRRQGGTGLGLAIVKHILEVHGQQLHIESTPGEGATFWFSLETA